MVKSFELELFKCGSNSYHPEKNQTNISNMPTISKMTYFWGKKQQKECEFLRKCTKDLPIRGALQRKPPLSYHPPIYQMPSSTPLTWIYRSIEL